MRVTNSATYRNFTNSVNDVHGKLNKSMNKVSSGRAYEAAKENPLAYYDGKKIDNQYQDILSKMALSTNVKNRIYQQELGVRAIQNRLTEAKTKIEYIRSDSNNGDEKLVDTVKDDLLQKAQSMVNELNGQFQNFYIYGGSDTSTTPFSLSADGQELTFNHTFPGDNNPTQIKMKLGKDAATGEFNLNYSMKRADGTTVDDTTAAGKTEILGKIESAMSEQGRVDVGYGNLANKDTLLDTFTGGLNALTGLSSDAVRAGAGIAKIEERLLNSPIFLIAQGVTTMEDYKNGGSKETFSEELGKIMDKMTDTEHNVSTAYSDLGNKYALLETTEEKMNLMKVNLTEQYKDILGADPYESIMDMYSYQFSYNSALKVGSNMMQSSLFDFMR